MIAQNESRIKVSTRFFNKRFIPFIHDETPFQIILGGGGSGKSVFAGQRCALDLWGGKRNYLIARKVADTLRDSIYAEVKAAIQGFGEEFASMFSFSLQPLRITCLETGCVAMFKGLDDVQKVKSIRAPNGPITDLLVEEAPECTADDIDQMWLRCRGKCKVIKRKTLLLNPVDARHWIAKKHCTGLADDALEYRESGLVVMRSTYRDNRFLAPDDITKIEAFKITNPDFYRVYGLGLWGSLGSVIFKNWAIESFDPNTLGQRYNGLDFGFSNDPTAFIQCAVRGDDVYIISEVVRQGMTNRDIYDAVFPLIARDQIICDCSEPKSIDELKRLGLLAYPTSKGADSVMHGIQWLKNKRLHVHPSCKNMAHELSVYEWEKDRNGDPINKPIDRDNHCIDALRYALNKMITRPTSGTKFVNPNFV